MSIKDYVKKARAALDDLNLPDGARTEARRDRLVPLGDDAGIDRSIAESIAWLCRAQDQSPTRDGGVARHYSLISGWGSSYPETTGYIVPTMLAVAEDTGDRSLELRARKMLDWFVKIQFANGAFQGGRIDSQPVVPVTFNTGQILIGLSAGAAKFGEPYVSAMHRAAHWLVETMDEDGCWRRHPTPFAHQGEKAYETHVSWGLFEAARASGRDDYATAGLRNIRWALGRQTSNGWFHSCCLEDPLRPLTHTIGYVLRGVLEAYRYSRDDELLTAACRTADGLLTALGADGHLPGRLDSDWQPAVPWVCLTGTVQNASCWLMLYQMTGQVRYRDAGFLANRFVRRTVRVDGPDETRGAVKGALPVYGDYGRFEYLNWAAKFFVDANRLEREVRQRMP